MAIENKPSLYTVLSPALLNLHDITNAIVVIIDVLRATSTIATALYNGAKYIVPVDSVQKCIEIGEATGAITAGEREGKVAEGLQYGNSPFEYSRSFIENKVLVLTTTNGTKLLYTTLDMGAEKIITGSFANLSAVIQFLKVQKQNVILACAGWKNRINIEDTLFAGAVVNAVRPYFDINCDSSTISEVLYNDAKSDLYGFVKNTQASHYLRLSGYGLEKDLQYCFTTDTASVLPIYKDGRLVKA